MRALIADALGAVIVVALPFLLLILAHGFTADPGTDCIIQVEC